MVEQHKTNLNEVFHALSDPTRRAIIAMLRRRPHHVGELVEPFDLSFNAISKHIKTLERAGLVDREVDGNFRRCSLNSKALSDAYRWLEAYDKFWNESIDKLEVVLAAKRSKRHGK
jgi:DNA-binding transcriptional ArsR family regulator